MLSVAARQIRASLTANPLLHVQSLPCFIASAFASAPSNVLPNNVPLFLSIQLVVLVHTSRSRNDLDHFVIWYEWTS